ncbi:methyl-accepting chemotaxis protein [Thiohalorhabdus methylotrophus]|uniref:Methyl-accepting chemotaxis protein n=1 Tax=Thiohalorhabdus methylotrophus TaxID=3242694 RepID=A0ABV4TVE6_9GAMM
MAYLGERFNSIGARASLLSGGILVVFAAVLFTAYAFTQQQTATRGAVEKARALVLMAESVRERVAKKWDYGVYTTDKLLRWAQEADSEEARKKRILDAVPVFNAWSTAQAKAEEGGFQFTPIREDPREPEHKADAKGMRAIQYFRNNPEAEEFHFVDEQANAVRYFRPVRLGETCLVCHGDPARSEELWGRSDGKDITGHRMENKETGDLHGAFQVTLPLDKADAHAAKALWTGGGLGLFMLLAGLGIILWAMRRSIDQPLQTAVASMNEVVDRGDLTVRMKEDGWGGAAELGRGFNRFMEQLADLFRGWREESGQLASASEELSATGHELNNNTRASSQRVEDVTQSAREVNNVVQDVANNITAVSDSASRTKSTTQTGNEAVEQASGQIRELSQSGQRVGEVMDSIQAIAKKTDLLALNAAIEAANAGEQGKGFAVVADEVRKLAEQTSQATEQVNGIVAELGSKSEASVQAMNQVHTHMEEILEMIEHTDQTANQIAAAAEELAATMNETTDNMDEISGNVESVAGSAGQIEQAADQLGTMANHLREALEKFQTDR